jgi:hypothetical protein
MQASLELHIPTLGAIGFSVGNSNGKFALEWHQCSTTMFNLSFALGHFRSPNQLKMIVKHCGF